MTVCVWAAAAKKPGRRRNEEEEEEVVGWGSSSSSGHSSLDGMIKEHKKNAMETTYQGFGFVKGGAEGKKSGDPAASAFTPPLNFLPTC